MANRQQIISFINDHLKVNEIKDSSLNGLQVEGCEEINNIVFGVSASLELFNKAVQEKAEMVIVHHGLIWEKPFAIKGHQLMRISTLIKNNINLLAYHLPLDLHAEIGNNAQIIKLFKPKVTLPFGKYKGNTLGFSGKFTKPILISEIEEILKVELGATPFTFQFGKESVSSLAVVSGGASDMICQVADNGIELYITGDNNEYIQETCREYKLNFISAGHYNSEKLGIIALQQLLTKYFKVNTKFIDVPNPI